MRAGYLRETARGGWVGGVASGGVREALRKGFGVFWALLGVAFLWHPYAVGAEVIPLSSLATSLLSAGALSLGLWALSGRRWRLCVSCQALWLVLEGLWLAWQEPLLLAHPLGLISKSLSLLLLLFVSARLVEGEEVDGGLFWLLRGSMALVWVTEGLFPKILFQQSWELALTSFYLGDTLPASLSLSIIGGAQLLSGVLALSLRGRVLGVLLFLQLLGLLLLPLLVVVFEPRTLAYPFGPLCKNIPLVVGTFLVWALTRSEGGRARKEGREKRKESRRRGRGGALRDG